MLLVRDLVSIISRRTYFIINGNDDEIYVGKSSMSIEKLMEKGIMNKEVDNIESAHIGFEDNAINIYTRGTTEKDEKLIDDLYKTVINEAPSVPIDFFTDERNTKEIIRLILNNVKGR